ncbi:hypothetical protein PAECIP111802_03117 [Paenibacillus allorhizosphaerae]|uniref:Uncharacterized protein n=1 Tax=Paenibacillus allorhizosphaerae TaxID=2849866 RepID=A0ABN7TNU1_9BACL|nr:hypothetical protein PAECIP111802_03117 [Paenibacillus allorhizosphaerae]
MGVPPIVFIQSWKVLREPPESYFSGILLLQETAG